MKKETEFAKAVASGNDFIIIDRFRKQKPEIRGQISKLAKELCRRKLSVGADGLLLLEPSKKSDFKMRIFNPDGTEVDMCGNGSRCAALYAVKKKICKHRMSIETRRGNLQAEVKRNKIKINMPNPKDLRLNFKLNIDGDRQNVSYINTGVSHVVCFVQGLDNFDVNRPGRAIRYHPKFQPEGTNVDFVEVADKNHIQIRTYERGVEEETLACGTGCVAAAIVATYEMEKNPHGGYSIKVDTHSGETLMVYFRILQDKIKEVFFEGSAQIIYEGNLV